MCADTGRIPVRRRGALLLAAPTTVRESQRWRLLEAITEAVARLGHANASVADAIAIAGGGCKTLYQQFHDKEDCFLAAFQMVRERLVERVIAAGASHPRGRRHTTARAAPRGSSPGSRLDPLAARVFLLEAPGPARRRCGSPAASTAVRRGVPRRCRDGARADRDRPVASTGAVVAGIDRPRRGRAARASPAGFFRDFNRARARSSDPAS